jgi:1-acyl-sn-glycerol-3-phosphate acyltransferase
MAGLTLPWLRIRISSSQPFDSRRGALILSNHQSYLDPVLLGLALMRPHAYLARSSLFRFAPFRWLIESLNAFPIRREGVAKEGLTLAVTRLSEGYSLVMFPEGGRSADGELTEPKPGVVLLLRRTDKPAWVAGIAGVHDCWPRQRLLPSPGVIWVHVEPFEPTDPQDSDRTLKELATAMRKVFEMARTRRATMVGQRRRV